MPPDAMPADAMPANSLPPAALPDSARAAPARQTASTVLRPCIELLKPITWFAPMWAFGCGIVSSGIGAHGHWPQILAGVALSGPLVCGTSQAANDWFDRHVDAINEPGRPIPSGRVPGRRGLHLAVGWTALSLLVGAALGRWAFAATLIGLALAWAYSAPPLRLKRNGWWGNAACASCYEGLPWLTGAAIMAGSLPPGRVFAIAALYSLGAHGIMTLNDFKSAPGDAVMGIRSLPVLLGTEHAARIACLMMALPQLAVMAVLVAQHLTGAAGLVGALLAVQIMLMLRFMERPRELAPWYNGTGTSLYVLGMLVCAFALRPL